MASARQRTKNKLWEARWRDNGVEQCSSAIFQTKKDAVNFAQEQEALVRKGANTNLLNSKMTFHDFTNNHWSKVLTAKTNTLHDYQISLNRHILPDFGSMSLLEITPFDIEIWRANLLKRLAPKTAEKQVNLMASILKKAVDYGYLLKSPMQIVKRKKATRQNEIVPLTRAEVDFLKSKFTPELQLLVEINYQLCLRPSEALAVTVYDIDFEKSTLRVHRQLSRSLKEVFAPEGLKTKASYRTVDISNILLIQIKEHIDRNGLGPEGLLFKNRYGKPYRYKSYLAVCSTALKDLKQPTGVGPHILRHSGVSFLIEQGANPKDIQELVGHTSIQETIDTYGHLFKDAGKKLAMYHDKAITQQETPVNLRTA